MRICNVSSSRGFLHGMYTNSNVLFEGEGRRRSCETTPISTPARTRTQLQYLELRRVDGSTSTLLLYLLLCVARIKSSKQQHFAKCVQVNLALHTILRALRH